MPLFASCVTANRFQIVVEAFCVFFAEFMDVVNYSVSGHNQTSSNSCGVQIIGGSYPKERITDSILNRKAGFAQKYLHGKRFGFPFVPIIK